jgi:hypothetical protein
MSDKVEATLTATVVEDENGDLALLFPADVLARLGWTEGDVVEWQDTPQGVLVRKSLHSDSEL